MSSAILTGCGPQSIASGFGPVGPPRSEKMPFPFPADSQYAKIGGYRGVGDGSWMAGDAKENDLLYVSDNGANAVYVYSYPQGILKGKLTGFNSPTGLCVDKRGNVFVSNTSDSDVIEYARAGTIPIATFTDGPSSFPVACAVDATTGHLAVANFTRNGANEQIAPGDIAIYPNSRQRPAHYGPIYHPYSCAYDSHGDLFVDGESRGLDAFKFAELPSGSKTFNRISLNQNFSMAGGVQSDGSHVSVGDAWGGTIYAFDIRGTQGTKVALTRLDRTGVVWQFWIRGATVTAANVDYRGSRDLSNVRLYYYPGGGHPTKSLGDNLNSPVGVTISARD